MKPTPRNPSLELYRIIVMMAIVAHHFVVKSGVKRFFPYDFLIA